MKRFLRGAGRSRLPASVAGFMAASIRKLGWRLIPTMSPLSAMVTLPLLLSSRPATLSNACKVNIICLQLFCLMQVTDCASCIVHTGASVTGACLHVQLSLDPKTRCDSTPALTHLCFQKSHEQNESNFQKSHEQNESSSSCILTLLHWEMACCAVSAPSEMKLRGKPQPCPGLEPGTNPETRLCMS